MKAAIIGCGSIARVHVRSLLEDGQTIVGLCDNILSKADTLKEECALDCPVFSTLSEMISAVSPEVVHICTPHYLHAPMICEALRAGVAVLSEKPVCISKEQEQQIRTALAETKGYLGVCFQNRYLPANLALKHAIEGKQILGAAGQVLWNRDEAYYHSGDWRGKWTTEGGGVLINQALHTLDLMLWCLGKPKTLEANIANHHLKDTIEVEDTVEAALYYEDFHTLFYASTAMYRDQEVSLDIATPDHVYGVRAEKFYIDGKEEDLSTLPDSIYGKGCWGAGHLLLISDFYRCFGAGLPFSVGFEEAIGAVQATIAVYQSKGNEVPVGSY